jgi:hypothetical protein
MKKLLLAVLIPLSLGGCLSFSDTSSPPPTHTTVVVPSGSAVTCSNGQPAPC